MALTRIAIVGAGISGLSAAHYLQSAKRKGAQLEYVLFERAPRLGGVIQTETSAGLVIEAGPDSFLTAKPWAAELARELGIGDQLIGSNDAQRKTYVLCDGRLVAIPDGLQMMVPTRILPMLTSPLFSLATKLRMQSEYLFPPTSLEKDEDESVASFVDRHFGGEVIEKLADPLLAGIYGGDSSRLSARAVLPGLVEMEASGKSLVRAALKKKGGASNGLPTFTSFRGGMETVVSALQNGLEATAVRMCTPVDAIIHNATNQWVLHSLRGKEDFDYVIIATPGFEAARLLGVVDDDLARALGEIQYTSSATVALVYERESLEATGVRLPTGFGFLVPRRENRPIIAATFVHQKFDHRASEEQLLIRAFLTQGLELADEKLFALVRNEFQSILGITVAPQCSWISRWPRAMPQYEVGHLARVANIERLSAPHRGLRLIGNAYRGIGIPDCVREGKYAAEAIVTQLQV